MQISSLGDMKWKSVQGDYEYETTSNDSCRAFDVGLRQLSNVPCDAKREFVCELDIFIVDL